MRACAHKRVCQAASSLLPTQPTAPPSLPRRAPPSAKDHLLDAGICMLCCASKGVVWHLIDRYRSIDASFYREAGFLAVRRVGG